MFSLSAKRYFLSNEKAKRSFLMKYAWSSWSIMWLTWCTWLWIFKARNSNNKNENIKIRMNVIYLNICFFPSPVNLEKYISMLVLYIRFVVVFFFFLRTVIWKLKWSIVAIFAMAYTELLKTPQPMYVDDVIHFSRFYSE